MTTYLTNIKITIKKGGGVNLRKQFLKALKILCVLFVAGFIFGLLPLLIFLALFFAVLFFLRMAGIIKTEESVIDAIKRMAQYFKQP